MRKLLKLIAILAFAATTQASHADVSFNLDTVINGDTPSGSAPWLTATFTTISGGVLVALDNNMASGSGQYITDLLFNTSISNPTSLVFSPSPSFLGPYTSLSTSTTQSLAGNPTNLQAGLFNIDMGFGSLFPGGTSVVFEILGTGLTENSFNVLSADGTGNPGGWLMAAEVQGIPIPGSTGTTSGSIGYTNVSAVPEPEVYAMMGIGILLMGFVVHRRRK